MSDDDNILCIYNITDIKFLKTNLTRCCFLYSRFAAHLSLDEKANQVAMTALRLGEWMFYLSGSGFISNLLT